MIFSVCFELLQQHIATGKSTQICLYLKCKNSTKKGVPLFLNITTLTVMSMVSSKGNW